MHIFQDIHFCQNRLMYSQLNYYKCLITQYNLFQQVLASQMLFSGSQDQLLSLYCLLNCYNFSSLSSLPLQTLEQKNTIEKDNPMPKVVETIQIVKNEDNPSISNNNFTYQHVSKMGANSNVQYFKNQNYVFSFSKKVKERKPKKHQNRNIIPNSIHQILSYVQKKHKSGPYLCKIFDSICPNEQWTIQRYYSYQKLLRDKIHSYLKESSLKILTTIYEPHSQFYSFDEQNFYMRLARILARRYLENESIPMFLNCRRMAYGKKVEHLKNRRQLLSRLGQILREL